MHLKYIYMCHVIVYSIYLYLYTSVNVHALLHWGRHPFGSKELAKIFQSSPHSLGRRSTAEAGACQRRKPMRFSLAPYLRPQRSPMPKLLDPWLRSKPPLAREKWNSCEPNGAKANFAWSLRWQTQTVTTVTTDTWQTLFSTTLQCPRKRNTTATQNRKE